MAAQPRFLTGPRKGQFKPKNAGTKKSGSAGGKGSKIVNRVKNTMAKKINLAVKGAGMITGVVAAVQQATSADVKFAQGDGYWNQLGTAQKRAQFVIGRFVNRATGVTIWPEITREGVGFTFNPWGIFNKWTATGAVGVIYHGIGYFFNLPQRTRVKNFSWPVLIGGIVGGVLDPPEGQTSSTRPVGSSRQASSSGQPTIPVRI